MTTAILDKLRAKRANLAASLNGADIAVMKTERELVAHKEARAACQGALQQVDETILELEADQAAGNAVGRVGPR